ncbi:MAG: fused signal transduction protein/response regulator [Gammaproteobacteria bacterium RBG_16_57_12]|nr:MAG: fused signal transduction protein/response regulator [Gammaproteobacteria bacterium RBG_16_57_12]
MSELIKSIDERTKLAGANRLEILLFSLGKDSSAGREEAFGINVFKVREVMHVPEITIAPDMPPGVVGMVSLRGTMIPVVDLGHFCEFEVKAPPSVMIVTEYNRTSQGFLVHSVEQIMRMEWADIKVPPTMMSNKHGGLVTAVTELADGRIAMLLDVEKVMAETMNQGNEEIHLDGVSESGLSATILFADDSSVARKQIEKTLDKLGIKHISAKNGNEAWERLEEIAARAEAAHMPTRDLVNAVLTDIEMPGMDGYVLTKKIKNDPRLKDIPVVMHSSLSAEANITIGRSVGVDAYVAKFNPRELSKALLTALTSGKTAGKKIAV